MTPYDVIRKAVPGADDAYCESVIWGRTAFPFAALPVRELYHAARRAMRAERNNIYLCVCCDTRVSRRRPTCWKCRDALDYVSRGLAEERQERRDVQMALRANGVDVE